MIVSIPVNYICNLSCKYCYFEKNDIEKINRTIVKKVLSNLTKDIDNNIAISFFLDMKEPLLTQGVVELIIEEIEKYGYLESYTITIFTNGTLQIEDSLLEFLLKRNNISFHISLDGIHSYERGINKKQFIQIISNIKLIRKYFEYNIGYVIDDYTANLSFYEFRKVYLFFIKLGFINVSFYRKRMIGASIDTKIGYGQYIDKYLKIKLYILKINFHRKNNYKDILNDKHLEALFSKKYGCGAIEGGILGYDIKGNKHFCSESIGQSEKGYNSSMSKVELFKKNKCSKCLLKPVCNSPCILEGDYKCIYLKKLYNFQNKTSFLSLYKGR